MIVIGDPAAPFKPNHRYIYEFLFYKKTNAVPVGNPDHVFTFFITVFISLQTMLLHPLLGHYFLANDLSSLM